MTALMLAVQSDSEHREACKKLNLEPSDKYLQIIDILIENEADVNLENKDKYTALILAASEGNLPVVEKLLKVPGIKIDHQNKFGKSALFNASEFGKFACVECLVQNGANVNLPSGRGLSMAMLAAVKKHSDILRYLIENKADLKIKGKTDDVSLSRHI